MSSHGQGPANHASAPSKAAQQGTKAFSAAAKRDPALLPLALIIGGAVSVAAFFLSTRWTSTNSAERAYAPISNPWDNGSKSESSLYKYRYLRKDGKIEHAQPASSYETVPVEGNIDRLRSFAVPHHTTDK